MMGRRKKENKIFQERDVVRKGDVMKTTGPATMNPKP